MINGLATSDFADPLEERLAVLLPRLEAHLSRRARRLRGVEPEDLAQEVVARALRYREAFDEGRALWPWLRQVAERVLHDHRGVAARQPLEIEDREPEAREPAPAVEALEELAKALAVLTSNEREVLMRFHRQGDSVAEIAASLGLPAGTVKSRLSRARRKIAGLRAPELDDE